MSNFLRDVRHALRLLRKAPGFTAVAVLVLALGIGANTAIFGLVNAFLLRPLPGSDDGVLYGLYSRDRSKADAWRLFSYPNYRDIRDGNEVFGSLLAHTLTLVGIREGDTTRRTLAALVSENYFRTLGVRITEGRAFLPVEEEPGSDVPVAIVSHGYAQRRALGVGQSVTVNTRALTVVGITPRGFSGTMSLVSPEVWLPLGLYEGMTRDSQKGRSGQLADRGHHARRDDCVRVSPRKVRKSAWPPSRRASGSPSRERTRTRSSACTRWPGWGWGRGRPTTPGSPLRRLCSRPWRPSSSSSPA